MRKTAIIMLILLAACSTYEPRVYEQQAPPSPQQYTPNVCPAVVAAGTPVELGPVQLKTYAYGAQETVSPKPGTPLEYRIKVAQQASGNPPLTNAFDPTIILMEIYNDGTYTLFGTQNVPNIIPSNVIMYDPTTETWISNRGLAQGAIATQRLVVYVVYNGKTKVIQQALNVR